MDDGESPQFSWVLAPSVLDSQDQCLLIGRDPELTFIRDKVQPVQDDPTNSWFAPTISLGQGTRFCSARSSNGTPLHIVSSRLWRIHLPSVPNKESTIIKADNVGHYIISH